MDFGINLKRLRKEKNHTQEELGECLSVSPQTVSKWENGLSMPDISMLPVLADYFGITVDALLSHDADAREIERKEFAKDIHALFDRGEPEAAYEKLKASMGKWALSAPMNHLMSWAAFQLSKKKTGEEREKLLEEAVLYADRAIGLDGGETARTAQAKMTKCFCMAGLGRKAEAVRIAESLPSMYSSRERVLAKITNGPEQLAHARTALRFLEELREEMLEILGKMS